MSNILSTPLVRYAIYYFFMSASVAVGLTFLPVYCDHLGLSALQIALVSAALNIGTVVGSPIMAQLAHRYVGAQKLVPACLWISLLAAIPMLWSDSFVTIFPYWQLLAVLSYGSSVVVDYHAIRASLAGGMRFEHARLWGSVGFMATTTVLGLSLDAVGIQAVPGVFLVVSLCSAISGLGIRKYLSSTPGKHLHLTLPEKTFSGSPAFYCLLATVALVWASHSAMYIYLSIHLRALQWSGSTISLAWSIGVLTEIVIFIFFRRIEAAIPIVRILQLSVLFTAIRWLILAWATSQWLILASQILHGFSFGSLYLSSVRLVHSILPEHRRDRGQSLLSAATSGFGSLLGRLSIGVIASAVPMPEGIPALFAISVIPALMALILSLRVKLS